MQFSSLSVPLFVDTKRTHSQTKFFCLVSVFSLTMRIRFYSIDILLVFGAYLWDFNHCVFARKDHHSLLLFFFRLLSIGGKETEGFIRFNIRTVADFVVTSKSFVL
jgi:hypothetical protein